MSAALTQLAASALVGLTRKPPVWPAASGGIGEVLTGMEDGEAEVRFLRTAGVLAVAAEAGQEAAKVEGALPPAPVDDATDQQGAGVLEPRQRGFTQGEMGAHAARK